MRFMCAFNSFVYNGLAGYPRFVKGSFAFPRPLLHTCGGNDSNRHDWGRREMNTRIFVSTGILLFAGAGSAQAQTLNFKADVPFEFVVGERTLPAGSYVLQRMLGRGSVQDQTGMLVLRSDERKVYEAIITGTVPQPKHGGRVGSRLVFNSYQGRHYLSQVWISGDEVAHKLSRLPDGGAATAPDDTEVVVLMARLR